MQQNGSLVTSLCMQLHFRGKRGKYHCPLKCKVKSRGRCFAASVSDKKADRTDNQTSNNYSQPSCCLSFKLNTTNWISNQGSICQWYLSLKIATRLLQKSWIIRKKYLVFTFLVRWTFATRWASSKRWTWWKWLWLDWSATAQQTPTLSSAEP